MPDQLPEPEDVPAVSAEELVDGELHDAASDEAARTYPSTIGGAFYLLVLLVAVVGLMVAWFGNWRIGLEIFGGSLCFAGIVRGVLPPRDAGMLAVRNRIFDPLLLLAMGIAIAALAATIPSR